MNRIDANRPNSKIVRVPRRWAVWLCLAVALVPGSVRAEANGLPADVEIDPQFGNQVPADLAFRDEKDRPVRLADFLNADKPVLLNLAYFECPMLCNMVNDGLLRALKTMEFTPGREFILLTVSFDPREGPKQALATKKKSLARYGKPEASEGWHFLTGEEKDIRRLTDAVGFRYTYDDERGLYAHAAGLFVLTPEGQVSHYLNGVQFSARDLRLSLVEASDRRIGTATDYVLLLCYAYDPLTGKYGMAIMTALRVGGVLTVFGMVLGFRSLVRRQRAMQAEAEVGGKQEEIRFDAGQPGVMNEQ